MPEIEEWRKRPVTVRMLKWDGANEDHLREFTDGLFRAVIHPDCTAEVWDYLHSTWVGVKTGQSVVCGVKGEFYPIDDEVRAETYDRAQADARPKLTDCCEPHQLDRRCLDCATDEELIASIPPHPAPGAMTAKPRENGQ